MIEEMIVITYGFSISTLQTDAIVQKQSVVFSSVSAGFCKQTKSSTLFFYTQYIHKHMLEHDTDNLLLQ